MSEQDRVQEFIAGLPRVCRRFLRELQKRGSITTVEAVKILGLKNVHWVWGSVKGPLVQAFNTWEEEHGAQLRLYDTEYLERVAVGKMKRGLGTAGNHRWTWVYQGQLDWSAIDRLANPPTRGRRSQRPTETRAVVVSRPQRAQHDFESPRRQSTHENPVGPKHFEPDESRRHEQAPPPSREPGWVGSGARRSATSRGVFCGTIEVVTRGKSTRTRRI